MVQRSFALVLVLFFCVAAFAQTPVQRLISNGGSDAMIADLRELTDTIGGRPTGSPACQRAVDWGVAKFREIGVDSVKAETFSIDNLWLPGKAEGYVTGDAAFNLDIAASPYSPSTPLNGTFKLRVVNAGEGTAADFARLGKSARGAVAIVQSKEMETLMDLFAEYFRNETVMAEAKKAGVAAILLQSSHPHGLLYRHPVTLGQKFAPMPIAIVSREQANRMLRLIADKKKIGVTLNIANQTSGSYSSRNVVAEIRGSERPDEIVLIGAHLDSWELGTGANDNGVNSALVIETARAIKALKVRPKRTIRFVLFTGEEQGMWGSAGYVKSHLNEMNKHVAVTIFDIGSGRVNGFFLNGREDLRSVVDAALKPVNGRFNNLPDGIDGTDNLDFLLAGVPNLVADQDAIPYLPDYHAESDVFENVDQANAKRNAMIASVLTWNLANSDLLPLKRQTRDEVDKLIHDTQLDEQMKGFDQWDRWKKGKLGPPR